MTSQKTEELPALHLAPVEVAARCRHLQGMVFFDSAQSDGGALSLIAAQPTFVMTGRTEADWEVLGREVAKRQCIDITSDGIPLGFAAGWADYDGSFCFAFYDRLLAFQHETLRWVSVGGAHHEWAALLAATGDAGAFSAPCFSPSMAREDFMARVERAQEYIAAGDIYQVNLSHRFAASWPGGDPFAFYSQLRRCSPAPHAAFLSLNGRCILSSSPELFLEIDGRQIRTRPIKGTRPRRTDPQEDARSARELVASPKERAELIMITDLERNDLGRVCEFGSVTASEVLKLERFAQVFHMVSTVEGRLRADVDHVAALRACFPGGSITGAPKKRAMDIIAELEPVSRGLFTGAIGYFGFNGASQFNIAIRTVVIENGEAHFHVGAGIVADSQPAAEWQETLDKAAGILLAARRS